MFYRFVRAVVGFAIRLFYKVRVNERPIDAEGPVMFVGNHPNSLIDPALIFVITKRHVTFLAKAPLFTTPVIGWMLKQMRALPVFRKQDDPTQMTKNEGTLEAAAQALVESRAITLFPEGKSHSEPQLAELKTGAARIAFRAARQGAPLTIVPVGLTYMDKNRFRSEVLIDIGPSIAVADYLPKDEEGEKEAVRALTSKLSDELRQVTLNLEQWEDLPVVKTAEALYAFKLGEKAKDADRIRRFAQGLQLFRNEQPERFQKLRDEVVSFQRRLDLVRADPEDLSIVYRPTQVVWFAVRNVLALSLGFPLFLLGVLLYFIPFQLPRSLSKWITRELDLEATVKFSATLVLVPIWWAGMTLFSYWRWGVPAAVATFALALPLAMFTRYFYERLRVTLHDVKTFFTLGSRARLKAKLLQEGERLSAEVEQVAAEYRPRLTPNETPVAGAV